MKKIKVLFITYPHIGLNRGGLQIQIERTATELERIGVDVVFYNPWKNQFNDIDICHVFSTSSSLIYHVERAVGLNIPVVNTPVANSFTGKYWLILIKVFLSKFIPGFCSEIKRVGEIMALSDKVFALNDKEKWQLIKVFDLDPSTFSVIPNGIDRRFSKADPDIFKQKYGLSKYVLQVGSIDENKNQLNVIRAISGLPYTLVIIGPYNPKKENYLNKCKSIAGENVVFIGGLSHDDPLLSSAYAGANLFILPSYREVMPLSLYEAALSGCRVAVSRNVPVLDGCKRYISLFDPGNIEEIATVIEREINMPCSPELSGRASEMDEWCDVAFQIKYSYEQILMSREFSLA